MNKFFAKHNLSLNIENLDVLKGEKQLDYLSIRYFEISDANFIESLPQVCKIKPTQIRITEAFDYQKNGLIMPHIDHYISCALNYYVDAGDCTTIFYDRKEDAKPITFPGRTTSNLYMPDQLIERDSFTALDNDCYLLNVSEVHGIKVPNPNAIRKFIQWQWINVPFEEVLNNLL